MRTKLLLLFFALGEITASAQTDSLPNITKTSNGKLIDPIQIHEVVVTGTRNETDIRHLPMTISVIDRKQIEQSMQPSILPILTQQVPGLFITARGIMGYGVSGGAAGGMSLRGIGSGSGRLMVLIDGHPQYMGLMGHPIADAYQSLMAERVEVLRGPASVLYGSNAMGGVINIVTRQLHEEGVKTNLNLGYGSFNTLQSEVTNRIRKGGFTSLISGSYNRTDGHRRNMGFEQYGGYAKLGYEFSPYWNIRGDVNVTHFNASQPGEVTDPMIDADQSITRGMTSVAVENRYERTSGAVSFFYNWGDHWINDGYTANPDDKNNPKPYRFDSHDDMMGISWYQSAQLFTGNRLTAGVDYYRFGGKAQNRYVEGERNGEREHIVDKVQHEIAGYIDFRQDISHWLTLDAGIRIDHHSHIGTEWIPQAGLSFHLPGSIELKASAGKGFRYPTIREMYMFPPKNPDLRPESMWNYELAFAQRLLDGRLSYSINVFYIDGKNLIVAVPRAGATPLNMNTGKIDNTGVEAEAAYRIHPHWSVETNYSYLHMDNPVLGAPEHKFYAGAMFSKNRWTVSTGLQYVANLYTDVDHVQTEDFVLWNINGSFKVTEWFDIWARGENLLAQRYEINAGYPMPKATIMAGINVKF
ncbi:TonB-dependent receptor [Barnesiella intestinihominis]|uniref:TonB-dependent receptor n=1 Tax=Barnesiella intestinihominis TaxID=487174 RepID=UPI001897B782|nr:TonB-dependent receptor [Barnesiella intestinihominis]MDB0675830.1 TonB-dependent receptor [Barnesiella intestinihominis]